jgi:hypothetical protein
MAPRMQNTFVWQSLLSIAAPAHDPYDDDEDEEEGEEDEADEADEDREPPVVREPDEDEYV